MNPAPAKDALTRVERDIWTIRREAEARRVKPALIRYEIATGTYETDQKLEIAVDRLLQDLREGGAL